MRSRSLWLGKSALADYESIQLQRDVVAADQLLKSVDASLNKDSSDLEIAVALAESEDKSLYNKLQADRDRIASDPEFVGAWNLLTSLGFDENTTDEEIEAVYDNSVSVVSALENLDIVNGTSGTYTDAEVAAAEVVLTRLGVASDLTEDEVIALLGNTDQVDAAKAAVQTVGGADKKFTGQRSRSRYLRCSWVFLKI